MTKKTVLTNLSTSAISSLVLSEEESNLDISINQLNYSISMIDNLLKPLKQNISDRIFIADNMAIESLDSWCRSIADLYSLYDSLLLPFYNHKNHWVLVYINTKNHFFAYIDPIGSSVAPDSLLKGLSDLKEKQTIQFNEVYISPIILQQDTYQCEPWLVLITQTLLAHGMAYNSYQLARILIFLSTMDIASIRLEQQSYLGLSEDIVPLFEISPYSKELTNVSNKESENVLASDLSEVSLLGKRLRSEVDDVNVS